MQIKSQLARLLTIVSLGKTPQTIRSTHVGPGLTIAQTHKRTDTNPRSCELGEGRDRFRERSLIEGSESMDGWGLRETRE